MEFKIDKFENHTLIKVLEEKLDTHIAPTLKSELVLVSGNGEKNIILDKIVHPDIHVKFTRFVSIFTTLLNPHYQSVQLSGAAQSLG